MAADIDRDDDLVRLNSFIDGESTPAERAVVAARLSRDPQFAHAHATLARLKACVHDSADDAPVIAPPPPGSRARRAVLGWVAAAAAVACLSVVTIGDLAFEHAAVPAISPEATRIALSGLPSRPILPRFDTAGLKLAGITVDRKMLADLAVNEPAAFAAIAQQAKAALDKAA